MRHKFFFIILICLVTLNSFALPKDFVYLKKIDPTIIQEIRYAGNHNFIGRPVVGYESSTCILTRQTAFALRHVQQELLKSNLSLKVYDCYRPKMAVADFMKWSKSPNDLKMKSEFYPRINKDKLFDLGYIAELSGHSRGSTVDLTIVNLKKLQQESYHDGSKLKSCLGSWSKRFKDNSIDMGSGYDCLDKVANVDNNTISQAAKQNRLFLRKLMIQNGFEPYEKEWWHFTLRNEPFKMTYFNFKVQ